MHRVLKLLSRITAVIFVGMLLYVYAFLPERVVLLFDESNNPSIEVLRETFFYSVLLIFVVVTIFMSFLKRSLKRIPVTNSSESLTEEKKDALQIWADGMSVMVNIFLLCTVSFLGLFHNDEHFNVSYFAFLVYLGPTLIIGWIFYLIYILALKK